MPGSSLHMTVVVGGTFQTLRIHLSKGRVVVVLLEEGQHAVPF